MAIKHSPGCGCCGVDLPCPSSVSQVKYIRSPAASAPSGRPWNEDTTNTHQTGGTGTGGTTLAAGDILRYTIKMCATSFGLYINITDDGTGNAAKSAGYDGFKVKVAKHMQVHMLGESLTASNAVGTPLEGGIYVPTGSNWYTYGTAMCGSDMGAMSSSNSVTNQPLIFMEIDEECYRRANISKNGSFIASDRIPPVEAGELEVEVTITAGDDDIEIDEISYVAGNPQDLITNHSTHAAVNSVSNDYVNFFRESVDAVFNITNPTVELVSGHYPQITGSCTNVPTGAGDIDFEITSEIDNTQFDGTHFIDLHYSQKARDWWPVSQPHNNGVSQWSDSVVISGTSLTDFSNILDQFRDLETWSHANDILDYAGYVFEDKEMDRTTGKLTFSTTSTKTANDTMVKHLDPTKHINQYLHGGPTWTSHYGLTNNPSIWAYIQIPANCDLSLVTDHYANDNGINSLVSTASRKTWPVRQVTAGNTELKLIEPTTFGVSADYDEDYTYAVPSASSLVGAGGTYVSNTTFGTADLTYTHTIFAPRSYGRFDNITDHCPHGNAYHTGSFYMSKMFLKNDSLQNIKLYDTDGTTLIFEADTIYHDQTGSSTAPTDSYVYEDNVAPGQPTYTRTISGLMLMDGINSFAGQTWGIYIPSSFVNYAFGQYYRITDFSGGVYSFFLAPSDSGTSATQLEQISWSFDTTNGVFNRLTATYYR